MRYAAVVQWVMGQAWAMHPAHLTVMRDLLEHRVEGHRFSDDELRARLQPGEVIEGLPQAGVEVKDANGVPLNAREMSGEAPNTGGGVLVVPIRGMIMQRAPQNTSSGGGTSTDDLIRIFGEARESAGVRAVLLDVDSPGGTTFGVQEAAAAIRELREEKRVVAQVNSFAGSAAYWLASQAHEVVITPSGAAGSIGVFVLHEDRTEMLANEGIKVTMIHDPEFKGESSPFRQLSDEAKQFLPSRPARCAWRSSATWPAAAA